MPLLRISVPGDVGPGDRRSHVVPAADALLPEVAGRLIELLQLGDEFNKLLADKGWTQGTFWMPMAGETEVIAEFDYPDLAAFERETTNMFTEPDLMALGGKIWAIDSVRPTYSELLSPVPSFG